jgi:hypothetical protein
MIPQLGYSEHSCNKHGSTGIFLTIHLYSLDIWHGYKIGLILGSFLKLHTAFNSGCTSLYSQKQCMWIPSPFLLHPHSICCLFS